MSSGSLSLALYGWLLALKAAREQATTKEAEELKPAAIGTVPLIND